MESGLGPGTRQSDKYKYYSKITSNIDDKNCDFRSKDIYLEKGNYYWIEAYIHSCTYFSLSVETPEIPGVKS